MYNGIMLYEVGGINMGSLASSFATNANIESGSCKSLVVRRTALELFVTKGFQSVSLRQLADAVGIQAGSLYNHIESKQTLLFDFIEELDSLLLHAVMKELKGRSNAIDALGAFVKTYMSIALGNRSLYVLSRRETCNLMVDQQADINRIRVRVEEVLSGVIASGRKKGVFHIQDDRLTAGTICATLDGALTKEWGSDLCVDSLVRQIQKFVLQAVTSK
ncbi:TetR/AcrR family transcriptional regulator [Pseudomonas sp. URMO17WK12:I11]|uniref:TetR/AcrR family transcriptional regulator n=1 Tax=Pseudomonas sp. URMO17WK12:I11 TaxID=1283291 RepID=UPI00119D621A|nr:TetR/AcrR family transcriptional regulator [Pseudomonas sp. URMO17WK12:I11]